MNTRQTASHDETPPVFSRRQIIMATVGVGAGMLLSGLDRNIVSVALPTAVGELGGLEHIAWVVTAYVLASTVSMPLWGKLGDLLGRRRLFHAAMGILLAGSALCGLSQSMGQLIVFRGIQGLGAGGIMALAFAIVADVAGPRERGRYIGYLAGINIFWWLAGPVIGGFLVEGPGWRWVFYVNLPIGAIILPLTSAVLPRDHSRDQGRVAIDYLGSTLLVAGVTCLLLLTAWGGEVYPWGSGIIVGLGLAGAFLMAAFVRQERRAPEPLLSPNLFRNKVMRVSVVHSFVQGSGLLSVALFLPITLQVVLGLRIRYSGLPMLPVLGGMALASFVAGRLISRTGHYKMITVLGSALAATGVGLMTTIGADTSWVLLSAYVGILGVGVGAAQPSLTVAIQSAVERRDIGSATAARTFFGNLGGALGVAVFGTVFASRLAYNIARHVPADVVSGLGARQLTGAPAAIHALPEAVRSGVIESVAASVRVVWLVALLFSLVALLVSLFLPEVPLGDEDPSEGQAPETSQATLASAEVDPPASQESKPSHRTAPPAPELPP